MQQASMIHRWGIYSKLAARVAPMRDERRAARAMTALSHWRVRAVRLRALRAGLRFEARRRIAMALMVLACAAMRHKRNERINHLALRLLLAKTLLVWRGANARSSARHVAHMAFVRWRRRAALAGLTKEVWLDSQRFNALGCWLDRWHERAAEQRSEQSRRQARYTHADLRSLLWV